MQYLIFNKPYGVLCQFTDPEGRPTLKKYISIPDIYAVGLPCLRLIRVAIGSIKLGDLKPGEYAFIGKPKIPSPSPSGRG